MPKHQIDLNKYPLAEKFINEFNQTGLPSNIQCYQIISRNNDSSGNPYRLIVIYLTNGECIGFEERSSMPNIRHKLDKTNGMELMQINVAPSEYKSIKNCCLTVIDYDLFSCDFSR